VPLDEAIVQATDTEAHINRVYSRHNSSEYISLYIAYGVRARDLMPHRPEVCYTGAGWALIDKRSMDLPLSDGMELPCMTLQFSRGMLNTKKTVLLNYYIVDGQYSRDVEGLRNKAWRGSGTVRYVAQVQIVASTTMNLNADSAVRLVCDFAAESASSISRLFESDEEDRKIGREEDRKVGSGKMGREEDGKIGSGKIGREEDRKIGRREDRKIGSGKKGR